jgi:hypothetical protein
MTFVNNKSKDMVLVTLLQFNTNVVKPFHSQQDCLLGEGVNVGDAVNDGVGVSVLVTV